nr:EOG090X04A7 [Eulimnadia texana]
MMEPRRGDGWPKGGRGGGRHDYRDAYRGREGYSPASSYDQPPSAKRMRPEWEERRYGYDVSYGAGRHAGGWGHAEPSSAASASYASGSGRGEEYPTQPPMMSFKAFLAAHDDSISDEEAVKKYAEYKQEFRRQQLNEFFTSHKDEEWFKLKYHPEEKEKRRLEQLSHIKRRAEVFKEFFDKGLFDSLSIDADQSEKLIKVLDSAVIKLEGGTDHDLDVLNAPPPQITRNAPTKDSTSSTKEESGEIKEDHEGSASPVLSPDEELSREGKDSPSGENDKAATKGIRKPATGGEAKDGVKNAEKEDGETGKAGEDSSDQPRELHRTASIFLRNLAPTITKIEVEAICKKFPGFLRAAIADPQPERRWFRRGWVTFERNVNIKEICWNLNNIRLRDTELGAIVNRDLSRRIRTVNGITCHKQVIRNDIRIAAKIIQNLDSRWGLWGTGSKDGEKEEMTFGSVSRNPVLTNITDYLIEEASAEEEELLGSSATEEGQDGEMNIGVQRDEELIKVLDRLLFYLRVVHSVDYYNHCEYPNEDEMPNRCGIMHARGIPPSSKVTQQEIQDYCETFESKIASFLEPIRQLSEEEASQLGLKEVKSEVEKFVQANTQELAKDKWLCPLSGKKFKGPDFVRKHIFNKHGEKVEEVKKDVEYFNNYLRDPKRPQLPEHPRNHTAQTRPAPIPEPPRPEPPGYGYGFPGGRQMGGFGGGPYGGHPRDFGFGRNPRGGRGRGVQPSYEGRSIVGYDDVDTPADLDIF